MSHVIRNHKRYIHLTHGTEYHSKALHGSVTAIAQGLWIATGLIIELLAIRFMLAFLGANPINPLFDFIYNISEPLVSPFVNTFQASYASTNLYRFEGYTLLAIAFYALLAFGLTKLLTRSEPDLDSDDEY